MNLQKTTTEIRDELEALALELEQHQTALCLNYKDWILTGLALATALPYEGEPIFQRLSAIGYPRYSAAECSRKWKSLANSTKSVDLSWLYKHAESHGVRMRAPGRGRAERGETKMREDKIPAVRTANDNKSCATLPEGATQLEASTQLESATLLEATTQQEGATLPKATTQQESTTPPKATTQQESATQPKATTQLPMPSAALIPSEWPKRCCRMTSTFVRALVERGIMTLQQAEWVTRLYWLGARRDGRVIFWQIDHLQQVHDGKVMLYGADCHRSHQVQVTWMSFLMRTGRDLHPVTHQRILPPGWHGTHCLFGQHLLPCFPQATVCIVEAEKTAVICAVRLASLQCLWLAAGGISGLNQESFKALEGREVILFPDTDPDGSTFRRWSNVGLKGQLYTHRTVRVYDGLERLASAEQKSRKIDVADLMLEAPMPHDDAALLFPEAIVPGAALATEMVPPAEGTPPSDHDEPDLFAHDPLFAKPEVQRLVEVFGLIGG